MLNQTVEQALNNQIKLEAESSQLYLAMASWAETEGLNGTSAFLYQHSDEERMHTLKLVKFVNERGGHAIVPALAQPPVSFDSIQTIFKTLLEHEISVTESINNVVDVCLNEKDYTTQNFMQWYVSEQIEEEGLARTIMDKL
ncbi:MAG: ferritin, partial [Cytophagales bacterium]|nr:ferritin [Cytophagales bacterium]